MYNNCLHTYISLHNSSETTQYGIVYIITMNDIKKF